MYESQCAGMSLYANEVVESLIAAWLCDDLEWLDLASQPHKKRHKLNWPFICATAMILFGMARLSWNLIAVKQTAVSELTKLLLGDLVNLKALKETYIKMSLI